MWFCMFMLILSHLVFSSASVTQRSFGVLARRQWPEFDWRHGEKLTKHESNESEAARVSERAHDVHHKTQVEMELERQKSRRRE